MAILKHRYSAHLALAVLALAISLPIVASAQATIGVIKLDVSRTTVYRGYQWVEVIAYLYTGPGTPAPTITRATATLTAGLSVSLSMTLVELMAPTTITVGGVDYEVKYLLITRVPIPEAVYTGKGVLRVEVVGRAAGRDFTFTRDIVLEIVDHRPVVAVKTEALVALERVRAIVTLTSALGVDVSRLLEEFSTVESTIGEATTRLEVYGEVEEALEMYRSAMSALDSIQARAISALAVKQTSLEAKINSLDVSLTQTIKSLEDLSRDLATSVRLLEESIERVSKASMDAVAALAKQFESYSKKVDESLTTLAKSVDAAIRSVADATKSSTEEALRDIASRVKTLDDSVVKLSEAQRELAARVSDISNVLQVSLIVVALMLLASVAVVRLLR